MVESTEVCRRHVFYHPGHVYTRSVKHFSCCDAFMPHHADWNRKEGKFGDGCTCRNCGGKRGRDGRTSGGFLGAVGRAFTGSAGFSYRKQFWGRIRALTESMMTRLRKILRLLKLYKIGDVPNCQPKFSHGSLQTICFPILSFSFLS